LLSRDQALGAALADVVHADVELVGAPVNAAPEALRVAASDVVALEDERPLSRRGEVGGAGEPAEAGADDDRIPALALCFAHG